MRRAGARRARPGRRVAAGRWRGVATAELRIWEWVMLGCAPTHRHMHACMHMHASRIRTAEAAGRGRQSCTPCTLTANAARKLVAAQGDAGGVGSDDLGCAGRTGRQQQGSSGEEAHFDWWPSPWHWKNKGRVIAMRAKGGFYRPARSGACICQAKPRAGTRRADPRQLCCACAPGAVYARRACAKRPFVSLFSTSACAAQRRGGHTTGRDHWSLTAQCMHTAPPPSAVATTERYRGWQEARRAGPAASSMHACVPRVGGGNSPQPETVPPGVFCWQFLPVPALSVGSSPRPSHGCSKHTSGHRQLRMHAGLAGAARGHAWHGCRSACSRVLPASGTACQAVSTFYVTLATACLVHGRCTLSAASRRHSR